MASRSASQQRRRFPQDAEKNRCRMSAFLASAIKPDDRKRPPNGPWRGRRQPKMKPFVDNQKLISLAGFGQHCIPPRECCRIDELEEDALGAPRFGFAPAMARKGEREGLAHEHEAEALITEIAAAQRHEGGCPAGLERLRAGARPERPIALGRSTPARCIGRQGSGGPASGWPPRWGWSSIQPRRRRTGRPIRRRDRSPSSGRAAFFRRPRADRSGGFRCGSTWRSSR